MEPQWWSLKSRPGTVQCSGGGGGSLQLLAQSQSHARGSMEFGGGGAIVDSKARVQGVGGGFLDVQDKCSRISCRSNFFDREHIREFDHAATNNENTGLGQIAAKGEAHGEIPCCSVHTDSNQREVPLAACR